jgi:hypothetical protein
MNNGKNKEIAHMVQIITKNQKISPCVVFCSVISKIYKKLKLNNGTFDELYRNVANKSTLAYIACYAKSGQQYVYLQRGYRNYGIPQVHLYGYSLNLYKG